MKRTLVILAAAALALPSFAQRKQTEPEPPRLVENIDVRIINVDVIVTDKRGNFIPNLKAEDFTILENGVSKPVANFYEVQGNVAKNVVGEAPTPPPAPVAGTRPVVPENMKRRIIFYVDNLSLSPFNRNRVFEEMKDFVKTVMRPGDEAMIATYNRSLKVRVPFTADTNSLITMIDGLKRESGLGIAGNEPGLGYQLGTDRVLLTLGGSTADLDRIDGATLVATVDVAGLGVGTHVAEVTVTLPGGVTLVRADPAVVSVSVTSLAGPSPSGEGQLQTPIPSGR